MRLGRDTRGSVTVLAAAAVVAIVALLALAVDLGAVYVEQRRLQSTADAAALAAVIDVARAGTAADQAIADNGLGTRATRRLTLGRWRPALPPDQRFQPDSRPNAVWIEVATDTPLYFARMFGRNSIHVARRATAARTDMAAFSLGARLAALDGGLANQLLSALTGSEVRLSVADCDALVRADLDLLAFTAALRTELSLTAASFEQVLATQVTMPQALAAAAAALDAKGNGTAAAALRRLAPAAAAMPSSPLSPLLSLGALGRQDHATTGTAIRANAYAFTETLLALSRGGRQVQVDLATLLPGLAGATLRLAIGAPEAARPWIALTDSGETIVRTAQIRLLLDAGIGTDGLLRTSGIAQLRVPLFVELAEAQAQLSSLSCGAGGERAVTLSVKPSLGHVSIADVSMGSAFEDQSRALSETPAALVSLPLIAVQGQARIELSGSGTQAVPFTGGDIDAGTVKTIDAGRPAAGIAGSLAKRVTLSVAIGPLRFSDPILSAAVGTALIAAAPVLDGALTIVSGLAGLHLGQADVRVNGLRCGIPALVG